MNKVRLVPGSASGFGPEHRGGCTRIRRPARRHNCTARAMPFVNLAMNQAVVMFFSGSESARERVMN